MLEAQFFIGENEMKRVSLMFVVSLFIPAILVAHSPAFTQQFFT